MVIVNITAIYVIKLHGQYVLFSMVMLVIGTIKHRGRCSPKGEGFVTTLVKIPCKYIYIYMATVMGHVFQAKWWIGHPSGCSFGCLWIRKLAKEMVKALKRQKGILAHLFMKIMEIRRKGR